jgi:hypothetical protein
MIGFVNDLGLDFLPNTKKQEDFYFYNEEIRYKIRKKNRKLKIQFLIDFFKKKHNILLSFSIQEILKLKIFTTIYSANENIVFNNQLFKIYSIHIFSYLKDYEEQKIYAIIINKQNNNEIIIIDPTQIQGKPFLDKNFIINYCK